MRARCHHHSAGAQYCPIESRFAVDTLLGVTSTPDPATVAQIAADAQTALQQAAVQLRDADVEPEHLAELVPEHRRLLIIRRPAVMVPRGRVWRLGVLLLEAVPAHTSVSPTLLAAGRATRAAERGRPNHQSVSREERREIAAAALRGGYPEGTAVHFDAVPIPLDAEGIAQLASVPRADMPVGATHAELRVRWRAGAPLDPAPTLQQYVRERVQLILDPPEGAN